MARKKHPRKAKKKVFLCFHADFIRKVTNINSPSSSLFQFLLHFVVLQCSLCWKIFSIKFWKSALRQKKEQEQAFDDKFSILLEENFFLTRTFCLKEREREEMMVYVTWCTLNQKKEISFSTMIA
jgi:hypothetical protein